jgi:reductive dehalogenase
MHDNSFNRRDFIKLLSIGGAALGVGMTAPTVIGTTTRGTLLASQEKYGDFTVEQSRIEGFPYQVDPDVLRPMSEKFTTFSRNVWSPERREALAEAENVTDKNLVEGQGRVPDQTRLDYALMAAAWTYAQSDGITYRWDGPSGMVRGSGLGSMGKWDPADIDMTWEDATRAVKHASLFFGASLAGVAELNPLWLYSDHFAPQRNDRERTIPVLAEGERYEKTDEAWYIPRSINRVIALAFEEDYYAIANSPGRLASAATGNGYSRMAVTASTLAEFIRGLGFRALPAGNGLGPSIPVAIDAGLGELGRLGLLVTPKYGPRVRLAKVITDMPLLPDAPIRFGVTEFCESCMLCAVDCPSRSITEGPRTWEGRSPANNPGVYKWYVTPEGCYDFNGFSCSNCKRVCPFTKPNNSWLHRLIRKAIEGRISPLNNVMVTMDQASGYGRQLSDREFWSRDGHKAITAREKM